LLYGNVPDSLAFPPSADLSEKGKAESLACETNERMPPNHGALQTTAMSWGCQHEKDAFEQYKKASAHHQLCVSPAGFFVRVEHPYFGASPDGMVCCPCCGSGICEVIVKVSELAHVFLNMSSNFLAVKLYSAEFIFTDIFLSVLFVIRMTTSKILPKKIQTFASKKEVLIVN